ncbi:RHTO0S10e02476g2_1 [Rhodotorula toruloides]|uniref:RHTO0S10e02476g2_1 n=1 Tax=Rhodotorula toruloides TaxID=5286 RepID=A0A061BAH0_RHOTO|nr:RHTO0S10e02476g2_1 [Rhodotorula toruloides]
MPVPPLPLELVRLILSFAAASLPKVERRENCLAFAQRNRSRRTHRSTTRLRRFDCA